PPGGTPWPSFATSEAASGRKRRSGPAACLAARCGCDSADRRFPESACDAGAGERADMRAMGWAGLGAAILFGCGQSKAPADTGSGGPSTHALTIRTGGSGSGTVRSSSPAFDCGAVCTESIAANAKVQLRAVPASGSTFAGWQGECSGAGDCTVTMDADRDVTATFSTSGPPPTGRITVAFPFTGKGSGRVTSSPAGIDCPGTCSMTVASGSGVSFSAVPDSSSSFAGWGGACSGPGGCSIVAGADQTVFVEFEPKGPPPSCASV